MIGQAVGNVKYGGRGRLSTLFAGVFLLILMVALKDWVSQVPVIALVAIMVMVSAGDVRLEIARRPGAPPAPVQRRHAGHRGGHHRHAQPRRWAWPWAWCSSGVFFAFKVSRMLDVRVQDDGAPDRSTHLARVRPVFFALGRCVHRGV